MRALLLPVLMLPALCGCAGGLNCGAAPDQQVAVIHDNPTLVQIADHQFLWETVADVVDDYFKIEREEPVRLIGNTLTEGHLETFPEVSPTILEPWRHDTASPEQRIENTLQSIRRRARVRVIPTNGGFWVEVHVLKELEDVLRPEHATSGAAIARYDETLTRIVNPIGGQEVNRGWIPQGRDCVLEQRILEHIHSRLGVTRCPPQPPTSQLGATGLGATGVSPVPSDKHWQDASATHAGQPDATDVPSMFLCSYRQDASAAEDELFVVRGQMPPATPDPITVAEPLNSAAGPPGTGYLGGQCDPLLGQSEIAPSCLAMAGSAVYGRLTRLGQDVSLDYQHFYSGPSLLLAAAALGTGAVLANTSLDQHFQNWYQADVRSTGTNDFAKIAKEFGNGNIMIPVFAASAILGPYLPSTAVGNTVGEWGDRCVRTVLVGGPPVLLLQWGLGASRPSDPGVDSHNSYWHPFNDTHGVSGHAFIGALSFINAAKMSDSILFKTLMYGLSTFPGWSRINDNDHYLSQVVLGWSFAYLAATAVDNSELSKRKFMIVPLPMENGMGVGAVCQW